jgi:hypothetical protein
MFKIQRQVKNSDQKMSHPDLLPVIISTSSQKNFVCGQSKINLSDHLTWERMEVGKLLENGLTGGLEAARCLPRGHAKPRVKLQLVEQDGTHLVQENFLCLSR